MPFVENMLHKDVSPIKKIKVDSFRNCDSMVFKDFAFIVDFGSI